MARRTVSTNAALLCAMMTAAVTLVPGCRVVRPPAEEPDREVLFREFQAEYGDNWRVEWHERTDAPRHLYGGGIDFQTLSNANVEEVTRAFLTEHENLLRIDADELTLEEADYDEPLQPHWEHGTWFISYSQEHEGVPVAGGIVQLIVRDQKLIAVVSGFLPDIDINPRPGVSEARAIAAANEHWGRAEPVEPLTTELLFLPGGRNDGARLAYRLTMPVTEELTVDTLRRDTVTVIREKPMRQWLYYVDAHTGDVIHRNDGIEHAGVSGTVTGPVRRAYVGALSVQDTFITHQYVFIVRDGDTLERLVTDQYGFYQSGDGLPGEVTVEAGLSGTYMHVVNIDEENPHEHPQPEHRSAPLATPAGHDWNWASEDPSVDDCATNVFYHLNLAHDWFMRGEPFDIQSFRLPDTCVVRKSGGAWSHYDALVTAHGDLWFYENDAGECPSALAPDVIYHEYTHLVVRRAYSGVLVLFNEPEREMSWLALKEAWCDYFAATMTADPTIGDGVAAPRDIDGGIIYGLPPTDGTNRRYPCDWHRALRENYWPYWCYDDYEVSLVPSGALWDMRKELMAELGAEAGSTYANKVAMWALKGKPTTLSECLQRILEADNGQHPAPICRAFGDLHGIYCDASIGGTDRPVAALEPLDPYSFAAPRVPIAGTVAPARSGSPVQYRLECDYEGDGTFSPADFEPGDEHALGYWRPRPGPDDTVTVRLVVWDETGNSQRASSRTFLVRLLHRGWPLASLDLTPAVGEVVPLQEGLEVVTMDGISSSQRTTVRVYSNDGELLAVSDNHGGGACGGTPALADLDPDRPGLELVYTAWKDDHYRPWARLEAAQVVGSEVVPLGGDWPRDLQEDHGEPCRAVSSPAVSDLDGDGFFEIAVITYSSGQGALLHVYNHDGTVWSEPGPHIAWPKRIGSYASERPFPKPALGDMDGDGLDEIVVIDGAGKVTVWSHRGTEVAVWVPTDGTDNDAGSSPALGDIDGDNRLEVVLVTAGEEQASVTVLDLVGDELHSVDGWPVHQTTGGRPHSSPIVADLNDDPHTLEVLAVIGNRVCAWLSSGEPVPGAWPVQFADYQDAFGTTSAPPEPVVGSVDEDAEVEVVVGQRSLYALNHDGSRVPGWPRVRLHNHQPTGTVALSDVDIDDRLELVAAGDGGYSGCGRLCVWDIDIPYRPGTMKWPGENHDNRRTRCYGGTIYLDVLDPDGGEEWPVYSDQTIMWRCVGVPVDFYKVAYRIAEDADWTYLPSPEYEHLPDPSSSIQYMSWGDVPPPTTDDARVKVEAHVGIASVYDISADLFSIVDGVKLIRPAAGEERVVDVSGPVVWEYEGKVSPTQFEVELKTESHDWQQAIQRMGYPPGAEDDPRREWTWMPMQAAVEAYLRIRVYRDVEDGLEYVEDVNGPFRIVERESLPPTVTVNFPAAGDVWLVGETRDIAWTHGLDGGPALWDTVTYSTDDGSNWQEVPPGNLLPATTHKAWTAQPADVTDAGRVMVEARNDHGSGSGVSGMFSVVQPGAVFLHPGQMSGHLVEHFAGEPATVTWHLLPDDEWPDGDSVFYTTTNPYTSPANWRLIAAHEPARESCSWVPTDVTQHCWFLVKAWTQYGAMAADTSDTTGAVRAARQLMYVDPAGDDANYGNSPTHEGGFVGPKRTIQAAINGLPGDDVCIIAAAGRYEEDITITSPVTLLGAGPAACTLAGQQSGYIVEIDGTGSDYVSVKIEGFLLTRDGPIPGGGLRVNSAHATVVNTVIAGNMADGVTVTVPPERQPPYRVQLFSNTMLTEGTVVSATGHAVVTVRNCILHSEVTGEVFGAAHNATIHESHNCTAAPEEIGGAGIVSEGGAVTGPPGFVDQPQGNYRLSPDSPCIDAGTYVGLPYFGLAPDIGGFEFEE